MMKVSSSLLFLVLALLPDQASSAQGSCLVSALFTNIPGRQLLCATGDSLVVLLALLGLKLTVLVGVETGCMGSFK